jgi:preprotein translocase subunit SecA
MFEELGRLIREEVVLTLFHVELAPDEAVDLQPVEAPSNLQYAHDTAAGADAITAGAAELGLVGAATALAELPVQHQVVNEHDIGRNDPCWCGSGKKFKRCHGS